MTEQGGPVNFAEEMAKFWQAWMSAGWDAMQRTMTLFTPAIGLSEWTARLREQTEKAVAAALEAARVPSAQDLQRVVQELEALRIQTEGMRAGMTTLESLVKTQQETWQVLEGAVRQALTAQQEIQHALTAWRGQWEERLAGATRSLEEWRQRWEETLRQATAANQAGQKSLEEMSRTIWEISRKVAAGQPVTND